MPPVNSDISHLEETIFRPDDFPVMVVCRQGKSQTSHPLCTHLAIEMQFICKGQGQYFIRDRNYLFQKNSLLLIHGNEIHHSLAHPDSTIKRLSVLFSPSVMRDRPAGILALEHLESHYHLVLSERDATVTEFLLQEMQEECHARQSAWQDVVTNHLQTLLILLDRARESTHAPLPHDNPLIQEVINYLEAHYFERIVLTEVADLVHSSPYALSRSFRAYAGLGFKEYLIHRRISEAKRLLVETTMIIAAIARKIGFDDLSTFNRDFKLLTGISPSTYRRLAAQKKAERPLGLVVAP